MKGTRVETALFKGVYACVLLAAPVLFWPGTGEWFLAMGHWWACIFLRALLVSFLLCPATMLLAKRFGILDQPDARKVHLEPTPHLGGLAVLAGILVTTVQYAPGSGALAALLAGAAAIYFLSVLDDVRPLSASLRLLVQLGVCLLLMWSGIMLSVVPRAWAGSDVFNGILTAFWIIGLLNAVNFLDGIDGLVGGLGFLCALLFLVVFWETRQSPMALLAAALAGACLGFLPYNWHRSATFLGDGGATVIGFLLAGIGVWGSWSEKGPLIAFSVPLLVLSIPIFDMIYTTVSRIKNGHVRSFRQWLDYVGKDHFHHRLMHLGMSQRQAAGFILTLCLVLGLAALVIRSAWSISSTLLLLGQTLLIYFIIVALMVLGRQADAPGGARDEAPGGGI